MQKPKKVPLRMCVGCREMKPKRTLIRIVRNKEGAVSLDRGGKLPGRGAYVCPEEACLKRAKKTRLLDKAFAARVPDEIYDELLADFIAQPVHPPAAEEGDPDEKN